MKQEQQNERTPHRPLLGMALMCCACFCNAAMATTVKFISVNYSIPNQILIFIRFSIGLVLLSPILFTFSKYRPLKQTLTIKHWSPYIIRICFGLLTTYAYFYAIEKICLSNAVLLAQTASLFIPIILWIWRGIAIAKRLWVGIGVGFIGTFLIVGPQLEKFHIGYLVGLIAGVTSAICYVAVRLTSYNEKPIAINFYLFLATAITSFAFCAKVFFALVPSFNMVVWGFLILLGVLGALFQGFIILAIKWAQIRFLSAFLYLSVAFAMLFDWMLFHKTPCNRSIVGLLLVCLGACLMVLLDPMRQKPENRISSD